MARFLDRAELERLGRVPDWHEAEHSWHVAVILLLTLTGARLSEVLDLKRDKIGELGEDGASARLEDTRTGPRAIRFGPEAAELLAALPRPEGRERVFPEDLTSQRLCTFWCGIREEAGQPGLRIHDCRHTWASQGVTNGVALTAVGRMLRHRNRETAAICAHLDDAALRDAAAQAASVIARAMNDTAEPPPLPEEAAKDAPTKPAESARSDGPVSPDGLQSPHWLDFESQSAKAAQPKPGRVDRPRSLTVHVVGRPANADSDDTSEDIHERRRGELPWLRASRSFAFSPGKRSRRHGLMT